MDTKTVIINVQYVKPRGNFTPWVLGPGEKNPHKVRLVDCSGMTIEQLKDKIAERIPSWSINDPIVGGRNPNNIRLYYKGKPLVYTKRGKDGDETMTLDDYNIGDDSLIHWQDKG